jgi:hypothetical protein
MISFNEWCKKRTLMEAFDEPSAFGGLLYRWGKKAWAWKDGTKEPRVQDIHPSWYYNFRVNRLEGKQVIEVPVGVIHTEYELEWLKEPLADAQHAAQQQKFGGAIEPHLQPNSEYVFMLDYQKKPILAVPAEIWDKWNAETIIGPKWDKKDEQAILEKAKSLGWRGRE